ncbi:AIM24 family protein [Zavarzinia sp. CC-PAN008]|uniref:AIM24 family protein n=1 Tax=Zavarzinia sp. CC-PAN008 TaxID=3243332 RepID=UPI003F748DA8
MHFTVVNFGNSLLVRPGLGEAIYLRPGAWADGSPGIVLKGAVRPQEAPLPFGVTRLRRLVLRKTAGAGEFLVNSLLVAETRGTQPPELRLSAGLNRKIHCLDLSPGEQYLVQHYAYLASFGARIETRWSGAHWPITRSTSVLRIGALEGAATGQLALTGLTHLEEKVLAPGEAWAVDHGHVVAFNADLSALCTPVDTSLVAGLPFDDLVDVGLGGVDRAPLRQRVGTFYRSVLTREGPWVYNFCNRTERPLALYIQADRRVSWSDQPGLLGENLPGGRFVGKYLRMLLKPFGLS